MFVGVATTALADKLALPTLGTSPLLAGEAKAVQRGKKIALKPDANVRLLALYGVGDQSTSLRTWVSKAPAWCETRLLELPGHGYRADESLPPCAARRDAPVPPSALEEQRAAWVASLADEVAPLLDQPYAFYGFSFGALLLYELCLELNRRGAPPPLALVASGRGAPHAVSFSRQRLSDVQSYSDEQVLEYFATAFGLSSEKIAPSVRERAASLFRCGALLGALPVGTDYELDGAHDLWDDVDVPLAHASDVPRVVCPVLSLAGDRDRCWPDSLVARWRDVAPDAYRGIVFEETAHQALMTSPAARHEVYAELYARLRKGKGARGLNGIISVR